MGVWFCGESWEVGDLLNKECYFLNKKVIKHLKEDCMINNDVSQIKFASFLCNAHELRFLKLISLNFIWEKFLPSEEKSIEIFWLFKNLLIWFLTGQWNALY